MCEKIAFLFNITPDKNCTGVENFSVIQIRSLNKKSPPTCKNGLKLTNYVHIFTFRSCIPFDKRWLLQLPPAGGIHAPRSSNCSLRPPAPPPAPPCRGCPRRVRRRGTAKRRSTPCDKSGRPEGRGKSGPGVCGMRPLAWGGGAGRPTTMVMVGKGGRG